MKKTENEKNIKTIIRDAKEAKLKKPEPEIIPFSELEINGVYLTHTKDLVQVRQIDTANSKLLVFNMTEQCKQWLDGKRHIIVERKR